MSLDNSIHTESTFHHICQAIGYSLWGFHFETTKPRKKAEGHEQQQGLIVFPNILYIHKYRKPPKELLSPGIWWVCDHKPYIQIQRWDHFSVPITVFENLFINGKPRTFLNAYSKYHIAIGCRHVDSFVVDYRKQDSNVMCFAVKSALLQHHSMNETLWFWGQQEGKVCKADPSVLTYFFFFLLLSVLLLESSLQYLHGNKVVTRTRSKGNSLLCSLQWQ